VGWSWRTSKAVYLGHRPYLVKGKWLWGKTIGRALYKMGWMVGEKGDPQAWGRGVAMQNAICNGHVPILSDLSNRILELTEGSKITRPRYDPNRPWEWTCHDSLEYDRGTIEELVSSYDSSAQEGGYSFRITVEEMQSCIAAIRAIPSLPYVIEHNLLTKLAILDEC
jgi:hypothetical protein